MCEHLHRNPRSPNKPLVKMNIIRSQVYDFQLDMEQNESVQGIRWTPVSEFTTAEACGAMREGSSEKLLQAGRFLQKALLSASPNLVRDRKHHLKTLRQCCTGRQLVDSLINLGPAVQTRTQAVGVLQILLEEGVIIHARQEPNFQDKDGQFFRFSERPTSGDTAHGGRDTEDELQETLTLLLLLGPEALLTASLRKIPSQRTADDVDTIFEELLHIKAVSHLSSTVKRQIAAVLHFESHQKAGTVLFSQGDIGKSWYIIWRGSVNVLTHRKGLVSSLHEGDDFGELALVNEAPRSATIVLREDNCHFLRVDKQDFIRILKDVEANTVHLKEHGQDVLVLEKNSQAASAPGQAVSPAKYTVMCGTPEKILEYLLETISLDTVYDDPTDSFLGDFLLLHCVFMPTAQLHTALLNHYRAEATEGSEAEREAYSLLKKRKIVHLVTQWTRLLRRQLQDDPAATGLLKELEETVSKDTQLCEALKEDVIEQRKDRQSTENSSDTIPQLKLSNSLSWSASLEDDGSSSQWLTESTENELELRPTDRCVYTSLRLNERLYLCSRDQRRTLVPELQQQCPTAGTQTFLEDISSKELANHLTEYDWQLFHCIHEIELIHYSYGKRLPGRPTTANLERYLRRFNEVQFWAASEICLCADLGKRARLLKKFIKVAACCKEQRNMNSFFAIMFGLSNSAVNRLSQTWEKIPSKIRRMYQGFERLMDPSRNHKVYRLAVSKLNGPFLPFIPLLLKDMTFIEEGNKTFVKNLVNFEKMRMTARAVSVMRQCRCAPDTSDQPGAARSPGTARSSGAVRHYVQHLKAIADQSVLSRLSRRLEP